MQKIVHIRSVSGRGDLNDKGCGLRNKQILEEVKRLVDQDVKKYLR